MTSRSILLCALAALVLPGCPAETMGDPDVPSDIDAPAELDAPALPDAPSNDVDMDGVVTSMDCDDMDPAVGLTSVRTCTSVCGDGMQTCIAGEWSACSVGTECLCAIAGEMRTVPCPRCGSAMERCNGERWERVSACMGLLDCEPEATETRGEPPCLQEDRTCDATCHWGPWVRRNPAAMCNPGDCFGSAGLYEICNDDCTTTSPCPTSPCTMCP